MAGEDFELPAGGAVLMTKWAEVPLMLRRFGSTFGVNVGTLTPGNATALSIPADSAPDAWHGSTPAPRVSVCPLPG